MILSRRLDALEKRFQAPKPRDYEVIIRGGVGGERDINRATAGAWVWDREHGEPYPDFRARVWADVHADGGAIVVFGGLPDEFDA